MMDEKRILAEYERLRDTDIRAVDPSDVPDISVSWPTGVQPAASSVSGVKPSSSAATASSSASCVM